MRRRGATGQEAGHGAGHEDIPWTREEREACVREEEEEAV
jgi:hypothetical protein